MCAQNAGIPESAFSKDIIIVADTGHNFLPWIGLFPESVSYFADKGVDTIMLEINSEDQSMIDGYLDGSVSKNALTDYFEALAAKNTPDPEFNKKFAETLVKGIDEATKHGINFHFVDDKKYRSDKPGVYTDEALADYFKDRSLKHTYSEHQEWLKSLPPERKEAMERVREQTLEDRKSRIVDTHIAENIDEVMQTGATKAVLVFGANHFTETDDLDDILEQKGYTTHVHNLYSTNWRNSGLNQEPTPFSFRLKPEDPPDSESVLVRGDGRTPDYEIDEQGNIDYPSTPPDLK